jgi:MFS family permease
MTASGLNTPLRRPVFRRLGASYAINEIGDWMGIVALSVLVYDQTGSPLATTVLFLGMSFAPGLLAPLLVAKAEQPPPHFVLPVLYCGEAAAFGTLAVLAVHFSLPLVFLVAIADGVLALAARALTRAVVAALLGPTDELRAGNALLNVAFTGGAAVGPAIAGVVVAGFGVQSALLLDAVSFNVVGWILFTAGSLPQAEPEPGRMRDRVRAGVAYIREQTALRRLLAAQGAAFVFFAAVLPVEVVYAKETLGTGDSGYGLMLASWGAGMVIGGLVFARIRETSLPYQLLFSTLAVGASYVALAFAPTLAVACMASVLGGAGNGIQWVAAISAVQELTAEAMQARVMSVLESIGAAMPGIGFALGGLIAALATPRATFFVAGCGVFVIVVVMAPLLGTAWLEPDERSDSVLDAREGIVVELLPGRKPDITSIEEGP